MLSLIPKEILQAAVHNKKDSLRRVISRFRSGYLSESECRRTCRDILYKEIWDGKQPPAGLEPLPEDLIRPDYHAGHFPDDLIIGWDIWGALQNPQVMLDNAVHLKTPITLIDHHGLKTKVEGLQNHKGSTYIGFGTIEGYTSARPREIQITTGPKGQIRCLSTKQGKDDVNVFQRFPLWQEYHRKMQELAGQGEDIITQLISEI